MPLTEVKLMFGTMYVFVATKYRLLMVEENFVWKAVLKVPHDAFTGMYTV